VKNGLFLNLQWKNEQRSTIRQNKLNSLVLKSNRVKDSEKIRIHVFGKKRYAAHDIHQLLFKIGFFVFTKFSMPNGIQMDAHRIYDLTVFTCSTVFSI